MPGEQHDTRRVPLATPIIRQRVTLRGHALSLVVHAVVLAAAVWGAQKGAEALRTAGDGPGPGGGGGGGRRVFRVLLPMAAAAEPTPPPTPQQLVVPVAVKPLDSIIPPTSDSAAIAAAADTGRGAGAGAGAGPGTGAGTGGGSGGGTGTGVGADSGGGGGRAFPPQLQGMLIPPMEGRPGALRGQPLTVHFDVSERGRVLNVETEPEIRDRGYRGVFLERMRGYTFAPATLDGRPVRARFTITIRL